MAISIVGVVRDAKQRELREPAARRFYTPYLQHSENDPIETMNFEVRTRISPSAIIEPVRRQIRMVRSESADLGFEYCRRFDWRHSGAGKTHREVVELLWRYSAFAGRDRTLWGDVLRHGAADDGDRDSHGLGRGEIDGHRNGSSRDVASSRHWFTGRHVRFAARSPAIHEESVRIVRF